jgi:hypothetical protein
MKKIKFVRTTYSPNILVQNKGKKKRINLKK